MTAIHPSIEARKIAADMLRESVERVSEIIGRVEAMGDKRPQLDTMKRKARMINAVANWIESTIQEGENDGHL